MKKIITTILVLCLAASIPAVSQQPAETTARTPEVAVNIVLDELHAAAAAADAGRYFALFSPDAVFLGTAPDERWTYQEFWAYAKQRFDEGTGWSYESRGRNITFNRAGDTAWFDEALYNENYGNCRGSGVLTRSGESWTISQYNLSIPIPNDLTREVVRSIRNRNAPDNDPTTIIILRHAEHELSPGGEPALSRTGTRRATKLSAVLRAETVNVVFATSGAPSRQTVSPLARANGMKPQLVSATNSEFLASSFMVDYPGRTIVYCAPSGPVLDMLRHLGVGGRITIDPDDHDDLFIVTVDSRGRAHLNHLRY